MRSLVSKKLNDSNDELRSVGVLRDLSLEVGSLGEGPEGKDPIVEEGSLCVEGDGFDEGCEVELAELGLFETRERNEGGERI